MPATVPVIIMHMKIERCFTIPQAWTPAFALLMAMSPLGCAAPAQDAKNSGPVGREGLVLWWTFDEGKGAIASSSAGPGNQATLRNVEWVKGRFGTAIKFNGSSTSVSGKATNLPATNSAMTISWWQNCPAAPSGNQTLMTFMDDAPSASVQPGIQHGQLAVWRYGGEILVSAAIPTLNAWHHCAYTYDRSKHRLYVDGKLEDTSERPSSSGPCTRFELGRWIDGKDPFNGMLDDVRMYNRALSDAEVEQLAGAK